jgi:hypothetical protein
MYILNALLPDVIIYLFSNLVPIINLVSLKRDLNLVLID